MGESDQIRASNDVPPEDERESAPFGCPFCGSRIALIPVKDENRMVALCEHCEHGFSREEWWYYKKDLAA